MRVHRTLRNLRELPREIAGIYRRNLDTYGVFLGLIGVAMSAFGLFLGIASLVPAIAARILASKSDLHWLWLIFGASLIICIVAMLLPIPVGITRLFSKEPSQVEPPPEDVREYFAVSYALSSDIDHRELVRFAQEEFGETFPDGVDIRAVRSGCAIGLRLTDNDKKNIGFLDFYHFSASALDQWRNGRLDERTMSSADFVPISSIPNPYQHELKLVVGALFIDTAKPMTDYHLAHVLLEAGREYLNSECNNFKAITLYATIFSEPGRRWAKKYHFEEDIPGNKREKNGGGHDVYFCRFVPTPTTPRKSFSTYGSHCEYRLNLRI